MCGRFRLSKPVRAVADLFALPEVPEELRPKEAFFPTNSIPIARRTHGRMELSQVRWGLIPRWLKDDKPKGAPRINARGDEVRGNGWWRSSFKDRRCLIPADGFYEWPKERPADGPHVATRFALRSDPVFAMAGLWDRRGDEESAAIVTTDANELLEALPHDRMPVILDQADFDRWLDPATPADELLSMIQPYPATLMEAVPVGTVFNKAVKPVPVAATLF